MKASGSRRPINMRILRIRNTGKYKKFYLRFALEIFVGENGRRSHGDVAAAGRLVTGRLAAGKPLTRAAGRPPLPAAVARRFVPVATPPIPGARSGAPPTWRTRPSSTSCHDLFFRKLFYCPSKMHEACFNQQLLAVQYLLPRHSCFYTYQKTFLTTVNSLGGAPRRDAAVGK